MLRKRIARVALAVGLVGALAGCFANGNYQVGTKGTQVRPGLYATSIPLGGRCTVRRLQAGVPGFVGTSQVTGGRNFIEVMATDTSLSSSGCGIWRHPRVTSYNPNRASAKYGIYRVPTDLLPGTYAARGGAGCSWQRLSGFTGSASSLIAENLNPGAGPRVTIGSTDVGFSTTPQCGGWARIG